ncbi:MAG: tRNA epoxyqueuosine(34) reductase QueG [Maricaulaceae bacterium]|nr:tRNA epoxyqueuosine(34) reductase QueG [Maricaulaceae bacterium]
MGTSTSDPAPWTAARLKAEAEGLGFSAAGIARVEGGWPAAERLSDFVAAGFHGEMGWMAETLARRKHPRAMWDGAKSALVVAMNYGPADDPLPALKARGNAVISVYARGRDYHDVIKKRLKRLAGDFHRATGAQVKVFTDTAPLMEKPLAALAGLGWQGKHTNLLSRDWGNWLFLGVMLTDAELPPDEAGGDHCGSCRACLDICPTNAFPAPYQLDARRCISYLTIELNGPIPRQFRAAMGNRIYGCDDCLAVCPWNKFARRAAEAAFHAREAADNPPLAELAMLDDAAFRARFSGSPIKRSGRGRFVRNVLIAIGNSGDAALTPHALRLLDDADPLVRGAAAWALSRLDAARFAAERARRLPAEADDGVREEWGEFKSA